MLREIARHLDICDLGRLRRVCRGFMAPFEPKCAPIEQARRQRVVDLGRYNPLFELLCKYPDRNWSWYWLMSHKSISLHNILAHPVLCTKIGFYPLNPNISLTSALEYAISYGNVPILQRREDFGPQILLDRPNLPWDWFQLSDASWINIHIVKKFAAMPWSWYRLSENPAIPFSDIVANLDLPWNFHAISESGKVTIDDVINNPGLDWNWFCLSSTLPIDDNMLMRRYLRRADNGDIVDNDDKDNNGDSGKLLPWCWYGISRNPKLSGEFILKHINKINPYNSLIKDCRDINAELVRKIPETYRESWPMGANPAFTIQDILGNLDLPWNWYGVSRNPSVTIDVVKSAPHLRWEFMSLSSNKSIGIMDILQNAHMPWVWNLVSARHDLTAEIVLNYPDIAWDFSAFRF